MSDATTLPGGPGARRFSPKPAVIDVDSAEAWISVMRSSLRAHFHRRRLLTLARNADGLAPAFRGLDAAAFAAKRQEIVAALKVSPRDADVRVRAMALIRETCRRALGLEAYPVQMAGGVALTMGMAVEMDTGEGKTLTALFPAALFALSGRRVHVVTTNDYLAKRDSEVLAPAYHALGLRVGLVQHEDDAVKKRQAYRCDVVYVCNKEVAFDYLRDRMTAPGGGGLAEKARRALGRDPARRSDRVIPSLDVAVVDEIDSVLIDDAGIPLVISETVDTAPVRELASNALAVASQIAETQDFRFNENRTSIAITAAGYARIDELAATLVGDWRISVRRAELVREALTALHLFRRDQQYLVRDGKVVLIDQQTGRTTPDRFWGRDLQAMIELKEGLDLSPGRLNVISISFQRFFRGYRSLSGMSGTVREVRGELARVYGLDNVRLPRRRKLDRARLGRFAFQTRDQLWDAVAAMAADFHAVGRPLLIGVRTVGDARIGAARCAAHGLPVRLLTAEHESEEAVIVSTAGRLGAVTLATHLAGRGTDVALQQGVPEIGGLVVLLCEHHETQRVDRQFIGRCARQGDPGAVALFASLEDEIISQSSPWVRTVARALSRSPALGLLLSYLQRRLERQAAGRRIDLIRHDARLHKILAFGGGLDR